MANNIKSNPFLLIILGVAGIAVIAGLMMVNGKADNVATGGVETSRIDGGRPPIDADTVDTTMRTLTAKVESIGANVDQERQRQQQQREMERLEKEKDIKAIEARMAAQVESLKSDVRNRQQSVEQLVNRKLEQFTILAKKAETATSSVVGNGIPEGFGLDANTYPSAAVGGTQLPGYATGTAGYTGAPKNTLDVATVTWVLPSDASSALSVPGANGTYGAYGNTATPKGGLLSKTKFTPTDDNAVADMGRQALTTNRVDKSATVERRYTIPDLSTFVGSIGMSAIVGRIPVDGVVQSPYRFKVIVGANNLIANGHRLPELEHAIVGGIATGDLLMSCVKGEIDKMTFVFRDGTVRTVYPNPQQTSGRAQSSSSMSLGTISDTHGNPCIPGKLFTNAPSYLGIKAMLSAIEAAGTIKAEQQRTTTTNLATGSAQTTLTGDVNKAVVGSVLESVPQDTREWFEERQKSSNDVVYVPQGKELLVNIEQEIHIDYDAGGRKVRHAQQGGAHHAHFD